jgi:hypothetical protein
LLAMTAGELFFAMTASLYVIILSITDLPHKQNQADFNLIFASITISSILPDKIITNQVKCSFSI